MSQTPGQKLYSAMKQGNVELAREALREDPDELCAYGWLSHAARESSFEMVDYLLSVGLDVNRGRRPDGEGNTALSSVTSCGRIEMVKHLLSRGADPTAGRALIGAINSETNSFEMVKDLVEHGAEINRCFRWGEEEDGFLFNALSWAIDSEKYDIAEYLRSHGAVMPPEESATAPKTPADEIVAHFEHHFGPVKAKSLREIVPVVQGMSVSIHAIPPTNEHPVLRLFTVGMSNLPMTVPEGGEEFRYAELMIQLPAKWPLTKEALKDKNYFWPIEWLRRIAYYPHQNDTWLGGAFTIISNDDPPQRLAPKIPFTAIMLLAEPNDDGRIVTHDGRSVCIYSLYPLFSEERTLEMTEGIAELLQRFERFHISNVVDLKRQNVGLLK